MAKFNPLLNFKNSPSRKTKKTKKKTKLSRLQKPDHLSLEEWQIGLRKQFGKEQKFRLKNLGEHPVFSDFQVVNPDSRNSYTVTIRGNEVGDNRCTCPDFLTNALGTCKHIEFTLNYIQRRTKLAAALKQGYQPPYSEIYLKYGARREVHFRPGSECPKELTRLAVKYFDADGRLRMAAISQFDQFLAAADQMDHEMRCGDDLLRYLAEVRDSEYREAKLKEIFPRSIKSAAFKDLLKVPLYDYQREGALFAARAGRCLIADEMGLGKTIQAIAATEILARHFAVERVLIISPTSLKHQWQREIEKFTDRTVEVINGLRSTRQKGFSTDTFFKITNYDPIYSDLDLIERWAPDLVILDEAQRIKNWSTRTAKSVKKIESTYAIVLTGTPLENRLEELISIVQFVDRFRLGPTYRLLHEHQVRDEIGKVTGYRELDKIGKTLEPILIRRLKSQVLSQLPNRIDQNVFVPMTELQWIHHRENQEIVAQIVQKWRRFKFLREADQRRLMIALQNMRMCCDSSYLVDSNTDEGLKVKEITTLLGEYLEQPNTKVVIFSQWVKMHELLERKLKEANLGFVFFHGGVPSQKRKALVDRFRDDPECRVFLGTDAGGVGLNLQFAHVVMNADMPWNPAILEQRIGRVHRLGQTNSVNVVNFIARGTIEEGMLSVIQFKKSLFAGVLDGGNSEISLGGSRLNKFMETVEAATTNLPAELPTAEPREIFDEIEQRSQKQAAKPESKPSDDLWSQLLQVGIALFQQTKPAASANTPVPSAVNQFIQRDEKTGEPFLRLPVPSQEVIQQGLTLIGQLLESFRKP